MATHIPASTPSVSGTRAQSAEVADGLRNGPALLHACGFKDVEDADEEDELDQLDEDGDGENKEQSPQTTSTRPSKRAQREIDSMNATTPTTTPSSVPPPIKSSASSQLKQKATHKAKKDEFSDLAATMELSVQKQLDLERVKTEAATKIRIVKEKATIDAKLQLKMQKQKLRHELKMEKMKLEMRRVELEAARSAIGAGPSAASWGFIGEVGSASISSSRVSSPAFGGSENFSAGGFDVEGDGGISGTSQTFFGGNDGELGLGTAHQFP